MVAVKLNNFGGMVPAIDDRLLPPTAAALAQNTWLYHGTVEGLPSTVPVYTSTNPLTRKVFRIPLSYYDKEHIEDSVWLEFQNPDVDVIKSPVANDSYERFYWASSQFYSNDPPRYNTRQRIIDKQSPFLLGIPTPAKAPYVSRISGTYSFNPDYFNFNVGGGFAKLYYNTNFAPDADTLQNGIVPKVSNYLKYKVAGGRASLKYGTVSSGVRVTISDTGAITVGIPPKSSTPGSATPSTGNGVLETRAYVYTWVSAYGEEGPPSPASLYTAWSGDPWLIKVTQPTSADSTNRNLSKVRIYRTVSGVGGQTTYFFVAELDISVLLYTDTIPDSTVVNNNQLESTYWTAPPSDLDGWVIMPNGIIAGWRNNEIWFSEPYRPHAWPVTYTVNTEYKIIGLGVLGQTIIACTSSSPYAVTGINPASMSMSRIASLEGCLSRGSIVSTLQGVLYASQNGLILVRPGVAELVTREIITKDQWLDALDITSLRATSFNNAYYCYGSVKTGAFEPTAFNTSAFLQLDFGGAYKGAIIDFNNQRVVYSTLLTTDPVYDLWVDSWSGEIFHYQSSQVKWLDIRTSRPHGSYIWRSKIMEMPFRKNLEAARVWFTVPQGSPTLNPVPNTNLVQTLADDQYGLMRVYADGTLVFTREIRTSGALFRLPSGFRATYWQVEIEGRVNINSIEVATSAKELGVV